MPYKIFDVSFTNNVLSFKSDIEIPNLSIEQYPVEILRNEDYYQVDFNSINDIDFTKGRYQLTTYVNGEIIRLHSDEFNSLPEADRYFRLSNNVMQYVYFTINGYLNFSVLPVTDFLKIVEKSYPNFRRITRDLEVIKFDIRNNQGIFWNIPVIDSVIAQNQHDVNDVITLPFNRENDQTYIDFSDLLNLRNGRYYIFLKIAGKNIRLHNQEVMEKEISERNFALQAPMSVMRPVNEATQYYLYFSVNGRLAFLKSNQINFDWKNYTGTVSVTNVHGFEADNRLAIEFELEKNVKYELELRNDKEIYRFQADYYSQGVSFNLDEKLSGVYQASVLSEKEGWIYNDLIKNHLSSEAEVITAVKAKYHNDLLQLEFIDPLIYYLNKKEIPVREAYQNDNNVRINLAFIPEYSNLLLYAHSRKTKQELPLEFEILDGNLLVNTEPLKDNSEEQIFDIYALIDGEKFNFKNPSALRLPVKQRYQEHIDNGYRYSLYFTLGATLAVRKDIIDNEDRQLYKFRTGDLLVDSVMNTDEDIIINVPDKVQEVIEVTLLPRKGTNLQENVIFDWNSSGKQLRLKNLIAIKNRETNTLFDFYADYLLSWIDKRGVVHTSYIKAGNYHEFDKPLLKFKPYKPSEEDHVLVQNYLNGAHNLSVQIKNLYYAENYDKVNIDERVVLYETRDGDAFVDSPLAVFEYLASNKKYNNLRHVVAMDDLTSEATQYVKSKYGQHITLVERNTEEYAKYLLSAKYLFNNSTFASYFLKKNDQIYVNTWHGTPLKLMGMEMPYPANASQNVLRNLMMADYIVAQNERMFDMYTQSYRLDGIYPGKITKFGYPRMDQLINKKTVADSDLSEFGIKLNPKLPTILYAPTHNGQNRSNPGEGVLRVVDDLVRLRSYFAQEYNVIIKVHPFVYNLVKDNEWLQGALVPDYIDPNYVLSFADILVTDFSSIFVDFLARNKRIIFFVPNLNQYLADRGVYDSIDNWPGEIVQDLDSLRDSLEQEEAKEFVEKRSLAIDYYLNWDNGRATESLVHAVFDKNLSTSIVSVNNKKKNVLVYPGGMATNGITSVALNLTHKINHDKYNVFMLLNASNINDDDQFNSYLAMDERNIPIFIFGKSILNIEQSIIDYEYRTFGIPEEDSEAPEIYAREMTRLLPNIKLDASIDFSGYSFHYARYIIGSNARKRLVYLHNDLYADSRKLINGEYPHYHNLSTLFTAYKYFDHFVNVSHASELVNRNKLHAVVDIKRMTYADNPLAIDSIIDRGAEEIVWSDVVDIDGNHINFVNEGKTTFITAARLSYEKNQLNLVKAFAKFVKIYPNNRLIVLGDGTLRKELQNEIKKQKMEQHIILLGRIANPMPYIKHADVFVLPSLYEGQPMAMMEAMTLGVKYILSSNIPQSVELLQNGKLGYLTDGTDVVDILNGLQNVMKNDYEKFDPYLHNEKAMTKFYQLIE